MFIKAIIINTNEFTINLRGQLKSLQLLYTSWNRCIHVYLQTCQCSSATLPIWCRNWSPAGHVKHNEQVIPSSGV